MLSEHEIWDDVGDAVPTGYINITSNSEVVAVLTPSRTWLYFVYGAMVMRMDYEKEPPRFIRGSFGWFLTESLPPLPLSVGSTVVSDVVVASSVQRLAMSAYYGNTKLIF